MGVKNFTKEDIEQIKIWIAALRSGEYNQTTQMLHNAEGYCCLGVACKLFIENPRIDSSGFIGGSTPQYQTNAPQWLDEISEIFSDATVGKEIDDFSRVVSIINLNDKYRFTFEEIADLVEAVFIFKVMKK